jgi:hypothetical protein
MTLDELLKTPEGRRKVAASMVRPVRCGGADYIDGKLHLRIGGWLVPQEVLNKSRGVHGDPWPGIEEYQRTHAPYAVTRVRGRRV